MNHFKTITCIYMSIWSAIIGAAIGLYLQTINWIIELVWKIFPAVIHIPKTWQPWCILLPMGLIIGISQHFVGQYPLTIAEVLSEVKTKGHFDYHRWGKILYSGLLILGAGGSIGPEASASGLAAGMIYWLGRRYKLIMIRQDELIQLPWWQQIIRMLAMRLRGFDDKVDARPLNTYFDSPRTRKIAYRWWTLCGIIGILAFFKVFPQEGVIGFHLPNIHWQWQGLLVVIPAMVVGAAFGWLFTLFGEWGERWFGRSQHPVINGVLGGLLLACATLLSRDVLFSGEFSIQSFAHHCLQMSPAFLLAFAFVKAFVTNIGFSLGWRGGTIFPAIFSSLAIGAVAAHYLVWMPQLTVTIAVTVAITVIIERPLLTAVLLWLLLPLQFAPIILGIAYGTHYLQTKLRRRSDD